MSGNEKRRKEMSMVAPKSAAQELRLQPVTVLAMERGVPEHAIAGMCRFYGWAEGKQLTAEDFESAMNAYRVRPMGQGR